MDREFMKSFLQKSLSKLRALGGKLLEWYFYEIAVVSKWQSGKINGNAIF